MAAIGAVANTEQKKFWNEVVGPHWVRARHLFDAVSFELSQRLIDLGAPRPEQEILDFGCGTGPLCHMLAERAPGSHILGVDIAPIMIEAAKEEPAPGTEFMVADCQVHDFPPASFDLAISRFGSMFFEDPPAAFANIRRGMKPGARIAMVAWAARAQNPWFDAPISAAEEVVGKQPPVDPHAPGPMAFADAERVLRILRQAGFEDAAVRSDAMKFRHDNMQDVIWHATEIGPAKRILFDNGAGEADYALLREKVVAAFAAYANGDGVAVPAVLHFFSARNPG